ncbi:hypothetical protein Tco_0415709 [Tanacetum coccineum]
MSAPVSLMCFRCINVLLFHRSLDVDDAVAKGTWNHEKMVPCYHFKTCVIASEDKLKRLKVQNYFLFAISDFLPLAHFDPLTKTHLQAHITAKISPAHFSQNERNHPGMTTKMSSLAVPSSVGLVSGNSIMTGPGGGVC